MANFEIDLNSFSDKEIELGLLDSLSFKKVDKSVLKIRYFPIFVDSFNPRLFEVKDHKIHCYSVSYI